MQARYYDPLIGRFYSKDPVGVLSHLQGTQGHQGMNRYAYVNNNPYRYTDPNGMDARFSVNRARRLNGLKPRPTSNLSKIDSRDDVASLAKGVLGAASLLGGGAITVTIGIISTIDSVNEINDSNTGPLIQAGAELVGIDKDDAEFLDETVHNVTGLKGVIDSAGKVAKKAAGLESGSITASVAGTTAEAASMGYQSDVELTPVEQNKETKNEDN